MKRLILLPICTLVLTTAPTFAEDPPRPNPEHADHGDHGDRPHDSDEGRPRDGDGDRPQERDRRQVAEPRRERSEGQKRVEMDRPGLRGPRAEGRREQQPGNRPPNEIRERLEHLDQAIAQLRAADMHEVAERLQNAAAQMRREFDERRNSSPDRGGREMEEVRQNFRNLQTGMDQLREQVARMTREVEALRNQVRKNEHDDDDDKDNHKDGGH